MTQSKHYICGIHVTERLQHALSVQEILSEFGKHIKTRLGLHEVSEKERSSNGIVLIEFIGDDTTFNKFTQKLSGITGVEVQRMVFDHL